MILTKLSFFVVAALSVVCCALSCAQDSAAPVANFIPWPQTLHLSGGLFELQPQSRIVFTDAELEPLAQVLRQELYQITSIDYKTTNAAAAKGDIVLKIDPALQGQAYTFTVDERIEISANNYTNTAMASVSLLQAVSKKKSQVLVAKLVLKDAPHSPYRALMIDLARQKHSIDTLRQAVILCRLYKVNYLQLHLTDDQSFTFESQAYPQLATPGRHFTRAELKSLVAFADARGVTLIPEFDAPGHTTAMREAMPELFGKPQLSVINLGSEKVHEALDTLVGEMCEVFASAPYFHIGADEANFGDLAQDPIAQQAIKNNGYDDVHDLFLEYVVRMNTAVKKRGKQTIIWESFAGTGSRKVTIPKDIIVIAWETLYQQPQSLLDNGYTIINASWKPSYLTPNKRWNPDYIYGWNMFRWENHWKIAPSYHAIQIPPQPNDRVIGGMMCSWESPDDMEIPGLRLRLAPYSEKIWAPGNKLPYSHFAQRFQKTDGILQHLISPISFTAQGLSQPDYIGPFYNQENHFSTKMSLVLAPLIDRSIVRYTLDGSDPTQKSMQFTQPLTFERSTTVKAQAFNARGEKLGFIAARSYELHPLDAKVEGLLASVPHDEQGLGEYRTRFGDTITVTLSSPFKEGSIRYTTDGSTPDASSAQYASPIKLTKSAVVSARSFGADGQARGSLWRRQFDHINATSNLTTGKPVSASSSLPNNGPEYAADGIVDNEFYWDSPGGKPEWWQVDLLDSHKLNKVQVMTYWDDHRSYQYTIDVSLDGKTWQQVVDFSKNTTLSTEKGFEHSFDPLIARYIRVNMLHNTANPSFHLVEVRAFAE